MGRYPSRTSFRILLYCTCRISRVWSIFRCGEHRLFPVDGWYAMFRTNTYSYLSAHLNDSELQ